MKPICPAKHLQSQLLCWFDQHGRKHLPWQQNKTPYRVWISEIMLQQTQVSTVIPYYQRFMSRFPDILTLAQASEDEVLHYWAGLGYYSRARHLHSAAKMIQEEFRGQFPDQFTDLLRLPGIGRSTAGAILAIAFQQPATILDGNVKRVLTRLQGITLPVKECEAALWELAVYFTPKKRVADYTQAMMDLGATLCTRTQPQCTACPFTTVCIAKKLNIAANLPIKNQAKKLPVRISTFILIKCGKEILLAKRPRKGIWGGLWSLPELPGEPDIQQLQIQLKEKFRLRPQKMNPLPPFRHTFTHYHLEIHPVLIEIKQLKCLPDDSYAWHNPANPEKIGLPQPVSKLINGLQ